MVNDTNHVVMLPVRKQVLFECVIFKYLKILVDGYGLIKIGPGKGTHLRRILVLYPS